MKIIIFLLLAFLASTSHAGCWVVGEFKGYATYQMENYKISKDSISDQTFIIFIKNGQASVSGNDIQFVAAAPTTVVGAKNGTVETWAIHPETGRAIYTQTRSGFGKLDGGKFFVGKILKNCD